MVLVYAIKIGQLGRKNLAVRFNLISDPPRLAAKASNNIRIILQMDDGPEQSGQDDYEPDVAARAAPAAKQKAAKEYFLASCPGLARNVEASSSVSWQSGPSPG